MPRSSWLPLLLLAVLARPIAAQVAADSIVLRHAVVTLPAELAGFTVVDRKSYENEAEGGFLRYQTPRELMADVFVYPVRAVEGCAAGCDSLAVDEEAAAFPQLIPVLVQRGYFDSLRVDVNRVLRLDGATGALRGRHLRMVGTRQGEPVSSEMYLFGAGSYLLKVRSTHPPDAAADSAVAGLVRELVGRMRARARADAEAPTCADGPADEQGVSMDVTLKEAPGAVASRVEGALREHGFEVNPERSRPGVWVTRPTFSAPEAIKEVVEQHPGLVLRVEAEAAGRGTKVTVASYALCRVAGAEGSESEGAAEMMAAMLVMSTLSEAGKGRP